MKKILVPVDFSDLATDVIEKAGEIAKAFGSEVYILHICVPDTYVSEDAPLQPMISNPCLDEMVREEHDLRAMAHYLLEQGINARSALIHGPIVSTILHEAKSFGSDLIVIGTQSHGILYRTFIGSVSNGVLHQSSCPVMIIPQR